MLKMYFSAIDEITTSLKRLALVRLLGWHDVRLRYRRSTLGPFWLTLSMGVMISSIGFIFGQILKTPLDIFLPFLTIGIIVWTFIINVINDGCVSFIAVSNIIREIPLPLFIHILRVIWRNTLILFHNLIIFFIVLLLIHQSVGVTALLSIPGFILLIINLSWLSLLVGIVCTRYRDLPQVISSGLQVLFYLTPVMWLPSQLPLKSNMYWIHLNPFYHFLQIVRGPLLGESTLHSWWICILIALVGWGITLFLYSKYKYRIAYWL